MVLLVLVSPSQFVINIVINFVIAGCHTYQFERGNTLWLSLSSVGTMAAVRFLRERTEHGQLEWLSVSMKKEDLASKPSMERLREVKKKLKDFQKEFYKNDQTVVQRSTVESFMRTWLYENKQNELKPKSFDRLEQTILYQVIPKIGHIQLAAFQSTDVQTMLNALKKEGYSYSSVKKAYDAVNECFRTGVIQRTVVFNPALGVTVPAKKTFAKAEIRYYNDEEVEKLCAAAQSVYSNGKRIYRLGDAIIVDLNTGLRLAELLALKWTEVDFNRRKVVVNATRVIVKDRTDGAEKKYVVIEQDSAKSATSMREIDMNDACLEALTRLKEITGQFEYVLSTRDGN